MRKTIVYPKIIYLKNHKNEIRFLPSLFVIYKTNYWFSSVIICGDQTCRLMRRQETEQICLKLSGIISVQPHLIAPSRPGAVGGLVIVTGNPSQSLISSFFRLAPSKIPISPDLWTVLGKTLDLSVVWRVWMLWDASPSLEVALSSSHSLCYSIEIESLQMCQLLYKLMNK